MIYALPTVLLLKPHSGYPRAKHNHDFHEIIVVLRGTYRAEIGGKKLVLTAGGAVFYPAGCTHRPIRSGEQPAFFCIQWYDKDAFGSHALVAPGPSTHLIIAARWLHEQCQRRDYDPHAQQGLLSAIIAELQYLRQHQDGDPEDGIASVRRVLASNYKKSQALGDLAAMAGLGPRQLNRRFRARYGCLPMEYLRRQRVEAAIALLTSQQGSLSEIAQACGFSHASYLWRVLKADTGCSPNSFRNAKAAATTSIRETELKRT